MFAKYLRERGDKKVKSEIGIKIKNLRKNRKLTQQELADKVGMNRATICNYEVGRRIPHLPELELFAEFFGVSLEYFGVATKDEVFEVLSRAKAVFENEKISKEAKTELYRELMRFYLAME